MALPVAGHVHVEVESPVEEGGVEVALALGSSP
jgi:hypothetical protein